MSDRPTPPITLGDIAKVLNDLKARGVTLESLLYVAKEKVWWEPTFIVKPDVDHRGGVPQIVLDAKASVESDFARWRRGDFT